MIYFGSDFHWGHSKIILYCNRPYKDVEEMNAAMIKTWNETVKPEDTVYVIGDFSLSAKYSTQVLPLLNGTKILVVGNHDKPFKHIYNISHEYSKENKTFNPVCEQYLQDGWKSLHRDLKITLKNGVNVLLQHFPYAPKETDKGHDIRYLDKRPKNEGMILLTGHQHCKFRKYNNMIDVGFDGDYKLWSEDEIIAMINDPRETIDSPITKWYNERKNENGEAY